MNGALGAGWSFEVGSIGLSTRPESSLETPHYEIRLPAGTSDLVPCPGLPGEYRTRFEESFFRFRRLPATDGGFRWEVKARDGKQYSFGATASSRAAAPGDAARIVEWGLDGIVDRSGNFLEIDHRVEEGSLLPAEIRYTGHRNAGGAVDLAPTLRLELRWVLRPDPVTSYRFGFHRRLAHRLEALVFHAGGELQRTVRFRYERSRATGRSLLTEMVTVGADGVEDRPITFSYSQPALQLSAPQPEVVVAGPPQWASADATAKAVSKSSLRLGDVDGDARVDVCFLTGSGFDCWLSEEVSTEVTIEVTDNRGSHERLVTLREDRWARKLAGPISKPWAGALWRQVVRTAGIRLVDVNADGMADACARDSDGVVCQLSPGRGPLDWREVRGPQWKDADGWGDLATGGTLAFPDLDGDGFADVCARSVNGLTCALGQGDRFGPPFEGPRWSNASDWNRMDRYSTILYPDLDGDGGADVCARAAEGITCALFTGTGFAAPQPTSVAWSDAAGWRDSDQYGTIAFPDLNGDGLADVCGRRPDGQMSCFLGSGGDFVTAVPAPALPDNEGWSKRSQFGSLQFLDFNGDGRSDLCGRSRDGWRCWRGSGEELGPAGMDASPLLADGTGWETDERGDSLRAVDLSGSGSRAVCGRNVDGPTCMVNSGRSWELLTGWSNGRGASW
ncbi:MAG TPA: FG-GAP-like repeat-containing protein, partial [Thermoanaerobaculia bacterium]